MANIANHLLGKCRLPFCDRHLTASSEAYKERENKSGAYKPSIVLPGPRAKEVAVLERFSEIWASDRTIRKVCPGLCVYVCSICYLLYLK